MLILVRSGGLHPCTILLMRWSLPSTHRFHAFNSKLKQHEHLYRREVPLGTEVVPDNEDPAYRYQSLF